MKMATAKVDGDLSKCPVCFEQCKLLRKLSECKHSFCENCIYKQFSNSKFETEKGSNFICPLCRVVNVCPRDKKDFLNWIKALELATDASPGPNEMSGNMEFCFPCQKLDKQTQAVKHCVECHEDYCETCFDLFHSINGMAIAS